MVFFAHGFCLQEVKDFQIEFNYYFPFHLNFRTNLLHWFEFAFYYTWRGASNEKTIYANNVIAHNDAVNTCDELTAQRCCTPLAQSGTPTVTTDFADYIPGAFVNLSGANWQPGESVHIL